MDAFLTRTISQEDIEKFSINTGDFHPLHTNPQYCKENGFEGIMAHGMLVSSYASAIVGMYLPGENAIIISQNFSYSKPVYMGDVIKIHGVIDSLDTRFKVIDIKIKISKSDTTLISGNIKVKLRK